MCSKQLNVFALLSALNNVFVYSHTGLPLHEVGKGGGKMNGGKSKTINRNKGVGGGSTRKGKETKLRLDSNRYDGEEPWMEARTSRKKCKTSMFLLFISNIYSLIKFSVLYNKLNLYVCVI